LFLVNEGQAIPLHGPKETQVPSLFDSVLLLYSAFQTVERKSSMFRTKLRTVLTLLFIMLALATPLFLGHTTSAKAAGQVVPLATPDFTVTVSPLSQTRKRGTGAPYFVTINPVNGFNGTVKLSVTGNLPPNATLSISQPGLGALQDGEVDFAIDKHSVITGTFAMTIHAISGTLEHDVNISLTIV
jgi:hypothetical protein